MDRSYTIATNLAGLPNENGQVLLRTAEDDKGKLTAVGCVLTLLSTAVIFGVALPIVQWRDPETGQQLPGMVAILTPILIAAVFNGIGTGFLRLLGLRTWAMADKRRL